MTFIYSQKSSSQQSYSFRKRLCSKRSIPKDTKETILDWIVQLPQLGHFAVLQYVTIVYLISGAHLNPAVTIGLATAGLFWESVPTYFSW